MTQLAVARRTPPAAAPAAPVPLGVAKRNGVPVQADFKSGVVGDLREVDAIPDFVQGAWDYVVGAAEGLNPFPAIDALGKAMIPAAAGEKLGLGQTGPVNFVKSAWDAQNAVLEKARAAHGAGDYGTAMQHFTNWLVPLLGPAVDEAATGDTGDGNATRMGKVTGILSGLFAPKVLINALGGRKVPAVTGSNPDLPADALQFAQDNAIPLDAATATGSKAVRNAQALADNSLSEAVTHRGQAFRKGQDAALERVGGELADRARPADWTPERAGQHLRRQLENKVGEGRAEAGDAYQRLRDMEDDPTNARTVVDKPEVRKTTSDGRSVVIEPAVTRDVALATDLAPAKAGVKAWYDTLLGQKDRVGLSAFEAKALQALDKLVQAPDTLSLSAVDDILGGFKTIVRGAPPTGRAQAAGFKAVNELSKQVDAAARAAGPDAVKALAEGRAATRAKYAALEMLKDLKAEPVATFKNLMSSGDASLNKLRALAKFVTPADMATLGRAWIQQGLEGASAGKTANPWSAMKREWNKVGTETRKIVFGKDTALPRDIDHFLRVASEVEKNPNPSGSALTLWSGGQLAFLATNPVTGVKALIGTDALSRLLYSPAGVRLLTRGLTTPKSNTVATAAVVAEVLAATEKTGARLVPVPAAEDGSGRRPR